MDVIDEYVENTVRGVLVDYEGLWVIAWYFRNNLKIESDIKVKEKTFAVVRKLMEHNIMPDNLAEHGGFKFWEGTPQELYARILAEWPEKGIPTLNYDDCWFALKKN